MCCLECDNVVNMQHRKPKKGEVASNYGDAGPFRRRTNEEVFAIIDDLATKRSALGRTAFGKLETAKGFNHCPHGILLDKDLRHLYRPVNHTLRDWQHTACQDGICNTHIFNVLERLKDECNIAIGIVQ